MTVAIFIIVLVILIVIHELGHFIVAKWSGMRVDEFGLGYPPKIWGKKIGETEYTLNALPFGGFVKIHGEDQTEEGVLADPRAFSSRPKVLQALTLVAGVTMNMLLAYVLITGILIAGTPRALTDAEIPLANDAQLVIADVMPGSPAAEAGFKQGDAIEAIAAPESSFSDGTAKAFYTFLGAQSSGVPLTFTVERNGKPESIVATPQAGIITSEPERVALGVSVATVGIVPVSWYEAPIQGAQYTWEITKATAIGLGAFFWNIITFKADLSQVAGPVGIAGVVGNAYSQGIAQLLSIAAVISINLAIINLLPIPALDGGRLVFVGIEAITRRRIPPSVGAWVNGIGFILLILLMLVVTFNDIRNLL